MKKDKRELREVVGDKHQDECKAGTKCLLEKEDRKKPLALHCSRGKRK